jgi:hypothetical protein
MGGLVEDPSYGIMPARAQLSALAARLMVWRSDGDTGDA